MPRSGFSVPRLSLAWEAYSALLTRGERLSLGEEGKVISIKSAGDRSGGAVRSLRRRLRTPRVFSWARARQQEKALAAR